MVKGHSSGKQNGLHFDAFDFDSPSTGALVENSLEEREKVCASRGGQRKRCTHYLHRVRDGLSV